MKTAISAFCLGLVLALSGCSSGVAVNSTATKQGRVNSAVTPVPTASVTKNGDYPGKGKITKINTDIGSVEMEHEEIKDLMPAMLIEFYVKDKKMLDGLAVNDRADFVIRYKDGQEIIVDIRKAK
ncbi:MAG: copper-binding protein [Pyrinomonadaceae bacterium]